MSNRAILLNTEILSCDRRELEKARRTLGASYVEIGQAANRIPVPWLCCFRTADLHPVEVEYKTGPHRALMFCVCPYHVPRFPQHENAYRIVCLCTLRLSVTLLSQRTIGGTLWKDSPIYRFNT